MGWMYQYPHIPLLVTMRPTPRILLGKRLLWTEKKDGSCMAVWIKDGEVQISSKKQEQAEQDLVSLTQRCKGYDGVLGILKESPELIVYAEACRKGRGVTGTELYDEDALFVFDIYNRSSEQMLSFINTHQFAYHHKVPVVGLFAETRHRSTRDLMKFRNHVLEHCAAVKIEGMVVKTRYPNMLFGEKTIIQAKVKLDVPEPKKRKIQKGEPVYPSLPDVEVLGLIDHAWQELGTEKFNDIKLAMPLIVKLVAEEQRKYYYSKPKTPLFHLYKEYLERQLTG